MLAPAHAPSFVELYTPKLHTVLRESYGLADFRADVAKIEAAVAAAREKNKTPAAIEAAGAI